MERIVYKVYDKTLYEIKYFQNEHSREYLISQIRNGVYDGKSQLFKDGMLQMSWNWSNGERSGDIKVYNKGEAVYFQSWNSVLKDNGHSIRVENRKCGDIMVIRNCDTKKDVYEGEYEKGSMRKHGYGFVYDNNTGKLKYYGRFNRGDLYQLIYEFDNKDMIEYEISGCSNVVASKRIPIYVGEYRISYDEWKVYRHGKGSLIDRETGMIYRKGKWENGIEKSGEDLFGGWYNSEFSEKSLKMIIDDSIPSPKEKTVVNDYNTFLNTGSLVKELIVAPNSCSHNQMFSIIIDGYPILERIVFGSKSFLNVKNVKFVNNSVLKTILFETEACSYPLDNVNCVFEISGNPLLTSFTIQDKCFQFFNSFILKSIFP